MSTKVVKKTVVSDKRSTFCREYVKDYNATRAYLAAGYSKTGAKQGASRLLTNVDVRDEIARLERERREHDALTRDWVISKLQQNVARASQEVPVLDNKGNPTGEYRYEASAVNKGLELLGKIINVFEGHQKSGAINVTQMSDAELAKHLENAAKKLKGYDDV